VSQDLRKYLEHLGFAPHERPQPADVKKRWKELCATHHPDRGGSQAEFIKVTHAYNMLTDPEYRQKEQIRGIREGRHNGAGDLNIRVHIPISFEDAFFGKTIVVTITPLSFDQNFKLMSAGEEYAAEVVAETLVIPPGCMAGWEHLRPGGGHRCGEFRGDAVYQTIVQPHPVFRMEGDAIISTERVPLKVMLCGGEIEVTTMFGLKTVKVPAGTTPQMPLRAKKCGVNGGDHLIMVEPDFPSRSELQNDDRWKALGISWESDKEARDEQADEYKRLFITMGGIRFGTTGTTR
jgi:DnaJ-class molecular chaperone